MLHSLGLVGFESFKAALVRMLEDEGEDDVEVGVAEGRSRAGSVERDNGIEETVEVSVSRDYFPKLCKKHK